jgi:hypothetical protein
LPLIASQVFRIGPGQNYHYSPLRPMKVTSIVARGTDFQVKVKDRNSTSITDEALENQASLSTTVIINDQASLVFENNSGGERVGFLCAEEVI